MVRRKVAVFTGNRAEYGLQYPILKAIAADPRLEYLLVAGGSHLQEDFGKTEAEIVADGFTVHRQVEMRMGGDTLLATAEAIGSGILSLARILGEIRPDLMVVYGDRYEALAAMLTSTQMNVPTAHVEGGDYTEGGALDDSVRHAMTKLAHLHFCTNAHAATRVLRLGEEPWRVHDVGMPSLDLIAEGVYARPEELAAGLEIDPARPLVLFCQHSVTTEFEQAGAQVRPSLAALARLAAEGVQVIVTYPNNDAGGRQILAEVERLRGLPGVTVVRSLGRHRFHGVLDLCGRTGRGCFAGNSSAVIKETPAFGCPAVNIGSRQQGRLRADNVLDVPYEAEAVYSALRRSLDDEAWRARCRAAPNPYGAGNAGPRIAEVLATVPLDASLLRKRMTY